MDGLFIAIASLIYTLPALIVLVVGIVLWFVPVAVSTDNTDAQGILAGIGVVVFVALICLSVLYFLAFSFFYPAMLIHYSRKSTFGALFQVREIIGLATRNSGQYATAWLIAIAAGLVVGFLAGTVSGALSFIVCIGWILSLVISGLAGVWIGAILHHLYGQVALTV